jgi:hypothetical protein
MKKLLIILSIILMSKLNMYGANENLDPNIVKIDGPSDLGRAFQGRYSAPAEKGRPPYTYSWQGSGIVSPTTSANTDFYSTEVGIKSITASIVDQDGKKDSETKTINVHKVIEISSSGSRVEQQTDRKTLGLSSTNSTSVTQTPTFSQSVAWTVKVGVSGTVTVKVIAELSASAEVSRAVTETLTVPVVTPPRTRVDVYVIPTVLLDTGTWKEWGIGLVGNGNYEHRKDESKGLEFVERPL